MRVIEKAMIEAIRSHKDMKRANTQVAAHPAGVSKVFLHGNHIANVSATAVSFTLAGWNTPTTRSRVNALLREFTPNSGVSTKLGQARLHQNGEIRPISSNEWVVVS